MESYHREPYRFLFESVVADVTDDGVVLETTYFYPLSGGQPHDTGVFVIDGREHKVVLVRKRDGRVVHELEGKPAVEKGTAVSARIDEERRRRLMRSHTAAHIISAVIAEATGAEITGNQLDLDKIRIDFSTPDFDPDAFAKHIAAANDVIAQGLPVRSSEVSREEMLADSSLVKLAKGFPEHISRVRIVDIVGFDRQACGGTHVENTVEIGSLALVRVENKGAKNRRVYIRLASS